MKPRMEVIRFNEADVIVASGGIRPVRAITVENFYNGTPGRLTFGYDGDVTYFSDLNSILFRTGGNDADVTYRWLCDKENEDYEDLSNDPSVNTLAAFNGTYHSEDNGKTWLNDTYFPLNPQG